MTAIANDQPDTFDWAASIRERIEASYPDIGATVTTLPHGSVTVTTDNAHMVLSVKPDRFRLMFDADAPVDRPSRVAAIVGALEVMRTAHERATAT